MCGLMSIKERKLIFMADIKIIKKTVAPAACWFTVEPAKDEEGIACFKIELDRAYPYIWVASQHDCNTFGLALTLGDVQRAAVTDPNTDKVTAFNLTSDGIMSGFGCVARCISAGARKVFYVIPGLPYDVASLRGNGLLVSAQDTPVCPFVNTSGSW